MVRRRRRRLEVEAFHRTDAAFCPIRQQHQAHRRAVPPEIAPAATGVLPHSASAREALHGVHQRPVLRPPRAGTFIALVVVGRPQMPVVGILRIAATRPLDADEPVAVLGDGQAVGEDVEPGSDSDERQKTRERRAVDRGGDPLPGAEGQPPNSRAGGLAQQHKTDGGEKVDGDEPERQHPGVPEPELAECAKDRNGDAGHDRMGHGETGKWRRPVVARPDERHDRPHNCDQREEDAAGEHRRRELGLRRSWWRCTVGGFRMVGKRPAIGPERQQVGDVLVLPFPAHVICVGQVCLERKEVERSEGPAAANYEPGGAELAE